MRIGYNVPLILKIALIQGYSLLKLTIWDATYSLGTIKSDGKSVSTFLQISSSINKGDLDLCIHQNKYFPLKITIVILKR